MNNTPELWVISQGRFNTAWNSLTPIFKAFIVGKFRIICQPPHIIQIKSMNRFLQHRRTKTSQGQLQRPRPNLDKQLRPPPNQFAKSSVETLYSPSTIIPSKIQGSNRQEIPKFTTSHVLKSKYSRFPRQEDFLFKPLAKFDNNGFQVPKLGARPQEKLFSSTLKRTMKKMDSIQFFPSGRPLHQHPFPVSPQYPRSSPSFQRDQVSAQEPKSSKETKTLQGVSVLNEKKFFSMGLKETRSTVNLEQSISDVSKHEEESDCLNLSFEIEQLLNRSHAEKLDQDQKETHFAIKELESLLEF